MLFDLTNFYFEGRKDGSKKAQFGRSKEKRSDCKLLVLALCINAEGFIRYSSILAGNTSDPDSLPDMIDTLSQKTRTPSDPKQKTLVCLDAGIATEDNLAKIKEKGYNYLCVSRTRLTEYELAEDCRSVKVLDTKKQEITLRQVKHEDGGDYYLEINSPAKGKDERSDAHLFFGLLSYWIVNTIRYKLKLTGEMCYWTEIVRRLSTQKAITTEAVNALGERIQLRQCSEPTKAAAYIYQLLKYKPMPFKKRRKLCSTQ